jgi:hypothetical protein
MESTISDSFMRELLYPRFRVFSAELVLGLLVCCGLPGSAQVQNPRELVKNAVSNEVRSTEQQSDFWMYRLNKENKSGAQVKDMAETKNGVVARLISVNGRALTPEERAADNERLTALANNPEEQHKKLEDQKKEQEKILAMVRALPDALLYQYAGTDLMDGRPTVRLKFVPNPAFHPTTRETIAYKATEGTLWIDSQEQRILRLDATLAHDINIGWGIVGHIDKGGQLFLQQQFLGPGKWRINKLIIEATGQAFFFKSISLKQRQFATDYRPVPPDLSIAAAVNLLKKVDTTVAIKQRP